MTHPRLGRFMVAVRTWALAGMWLGVVLGIVTAARNDARPFADVLRLHAALAAVFGLVLAAAGAIAGILAALSPRTREPAGPGAFAAAAALTAYVWALRAFEFEWAYPDRWPFVRGYPGMLAFAALFAAGAAAAAFGLSRALRAAASRVPGITWVRSAVGVAATAVLSAAALAVASSRPTPGAGASAAVDPPAGEPAAIVPAATSSVRPLLVVGCDGADPDVLDALLSEGALPNLARLASRGTKCRLRTIPGHPSPALWTSIASSRTPRDAGIRDFYVQQVLGSSVPVASFPQYFGLNDGLLLRDVLGPRLVRVTPVNGDMVRVRRVWSILAGEGIPVGVVDWLVTWPARTEGAAFVVSDRAWTEARLARDAGTPLADGASRGWWAPAEVAARLPSDAAAWETEDAFAAAVACSLAVTHAPRALFVYFRDVDAAEHLHWNAWEPSRTGWRADRPAHGGPVRDAYVAFDRHLGTLIDVMGASANVLVVSDHGHHAWFTWLGRGTPGGHTDAPAGILVAAGPDLRAAPALPEPSVYDVAPTVLRLAGLPSAADTEGRVLDELLEDASPLQQVATWETGARGEGAPVATEADAAMIERLRALGYIR